MCGLSTETSSGWRALKSRRPDVAETRTISVQQHIMSANDLLAGDIRARLDAAGAFAINIMASPGGGKTSTILRTVQALKSEMRIAAVDGDIVPVDVDRIAAEGIPVELVNTGGSCHLDANMLLGVIDKVDLEHTDLLIIENVGNLVCPANFALGAHANVVIASVPEGADKPYKYPGMFRGADVLLLNKIDYMPLSDFDVEYFRRGVMAVNPDVTFLPVSCRTGEGLEGWYDWLRAHVRK
ncbi:MAG: hydrogenase nickel incorporation protein HypB [Anaerolineae bacterium]|nr:hydrogenase nickel incorporation protein HypB [Anaerolineae bacterium]